LLSFLFSKDFFAHTSLLIMALLQIASGLLKENAWGYLQQEKSPLASSFRNLLGQTDRRAQGHSIYCASIASNGKNYKFCSNENRLTVAKEGANKGRQFYACAKPKGKGCNYFIWANESSAAQNGM